jgi:hypothetical protein
MLILGSRLLATGKPWNGIGSIVVDNLHPENIGFKGQEAFFRYREPSTFPQAPKMLSLLYALLPQSEHG